MIGKRARMIWFMIGTSLCIGINGRADAATTHVLTEGEEWTISTIDTNSPVRISDQSIIKAKAQSDHRLTIRAVRSGVAEITLKKHSETQSQKIQIVVRSKNQNLAAPPNRRGIFPSTLCQESGVTCIPERGLITGFTSSHEWRNHARRLCKQSGTCQVNVELTADGAQRQADEIQRKLGAKHRVTLSNDGLPMVLVDCPQQEKTWTKEHVDFLLSGAISSGDVGLECSPAFRFGHFIVKSRITSVDTQALSQMGLDTEKNILQTISTLRNGIDKLLDLQRRNLASVLGEPSIELDSGVVGKIGSGSEIAYQRTSADSKSETNWDWHQLGLNMEVAVTARDGDFVVLSYKITLKIPSDASGAPKNNTSNVEGEVRLKMNELRVLATSQIHSDRSNQSSSAFAGKIPIIGPLLTQRGSGSSTATVVVAFMVSESAEG